MWRPRAFGIAGRADELSREEALRGRLELRLADVERRMRAAAAAGDDDEAERLHARYIELGTTYAGRMAADMALDDELIRRVGAAIARGRLLAAGRAGARPRLGRRRLDAARSRPARARPSARDAARGARAARRRERRRRRGLPGARRAASACRIARSTGSSRPAPGVEARARAAAPRGRRRACAPAGPSRPGTRATTASRRSSTASRPRRAPRRSPPCRQPTATGACGRCSSWAATRCASALRARGHRLARRLLERRPPLRAQPRAPRSAAGVPLAAPGGRGQPAAHGRAARRGRRRARRARRASCSATAAACRTAAVAAAPPAVLRRALRRVGGLPGAAPGRGRARRRARARALGRGLGAARRRPRRRAPLRPHRDRPRRAADRRRSARSRSPCRAGRSTATRVVHCALAAAEGALDAALAPGLVLRAPRAGERLPGARRTIARMLLEARVPRSERARYPVVSAHGEPVALPGIAVAAGPAPTLWTRAHTRRHVNGSPADPDGVLEGVLISEDELRARVDELGEQVSRDYEGLDPLLVAVLKGAVIFAGDLLRAITIPCSIDFMAISSYGSGTESSGVVRILKDLDAPIAGRHVLVVEDIVDSGPDALLPARQPGLARAGLARDLRAAGQARPARGRRGLPLRGLRDPQPLRRRVRAGCRRAASAGCRTWRPWTRRASAFDATGARFPRRAGQIDRDKLHLGPLCRILRPL